jgi:hypothetical protein
VVKAISYSSHSTMASFLDLSRNVSYFTVSYQYAELFFTQLTLVQIPSALVLPLLARYYSGLSGPGAKLFNRNDPRGFVDTLKKAELDEEVR